MRATAGQSLHFCRAVRPSMRANRRQRAGAIATLLFGQALSFVPAAAAQDASDQAKITAGETVYNTYCSTCHGDDLVNTGQTFDLRRLQADERPRFENSVRNGKNQMPPWKGVLSDQQIDQLWHYIRTHAFAK
jgi:mono/diheme cytochrome c family protein